MELNIKFDIEFTNDDDTLIRVDTYSLEEIVYDYFELTDKINSTDDIVTNEDFDAFMKIACSYFEEWAMDVSYDANRKVTLQLSDTDKANLKMFLIDFTGEYVNKNKDSKSLDEFNFSCCETDNNNGNPYCSQCGTKLL